MSDLITAGYLDKIKNYYIISMHRSGSTLLASILNNHEQVNVVFEENTYFLLKGKYEHVLFDSEQIIDSFVEDFYVLIFLRINSIQLPPKNELKIILKKYKDHKLNYRQFTNLFYLQFGSYFSLKKEVKYIINKEVNYHSILEKFYEDNPETKFVFLVRNCLSKTGKYIRGTGSRKTVSVALNWRLKTRHYIKTAIPKDKFRIILFEDLIAEREKVVVEVCDFFNIPFHSSMLTFQDHIDSALEKLQAMHPLHPKFREYFNKMHGSTFSKTKIPDRTEGIELSKRQQAKINLICYEQRAFFGYPVFKVKWFHYFYFTPYDVFLMIKTCFFYFMSQAYFKLPTGFRYFLRTINKNLWLNKNNKYDGLNHLPEIN